MILMRATDSLRVRLHTSEERSVKEAEPSMHRTGDVGMKNP
jgi:hypothetical protein